MSECRDSKLSNGAKADMDTEDGYIISLNSTLTFFLKKKKNLTFF